MLGLSVFWYCIVQSRLAYSAAILEKSVSLIREHPTILVLAVLHAIIGFLVTMFYAIAGSLTVPAEHPSLYIYLVFSFVWTISTFDYVIYVTGAGLCARDYFLRGTPFWPEYPVWDSFKVACTTSLGSSACAALLLAVIHALRAAIRLTERSDNDNDRGGGLVFIRCIALCLLDLLESIARFMSRYALIYCGVFGVSYRDGCKRWLDLSLHHWVDVLISGNVIETALGLNMFGFVVGSGLIGWLLGIVRFPDENLAKGVLVLVSVALCWMVFSLFKQPVVVMSDTLLVCWAEDPERLKEINPALHERFLAASENRASREV
jgi:hypothetical protein